MAAAHVKSAAIDRVFRTAKLPDPVRELHVPDRDSLAFMHSRQNQLHFEFSDHVTLWLEPER